VKVGEACILGFEVQGFLLVEPLAEQVQAIAGERDIVRGKREQQPLLKKATYWRRNVHAADEELALLPANQKGTILHSSVAKKMRQLNIEGLLVNQRLYGISQFVSPATGLPYAFRIPDYRIGPTILDLKPVGTSLSGPQVIDFMNFGNTNDVRFIFYQPW
jgi:hypothetical protein